MPTKMASDRSMSVLLLVVCQGLFSAAQWLDTSRYDPRCDTSRSYNDRSREIDFHDEYLPRDLCIFITPPEGSGVLTVSFIVFNFGYENENGNCTNFVEIGTGDMKDTNRKYCGTRVPPPFISELGTAWIWIHTDFSIYRSDLRIHYTTVDCGGEVVLPLYTFITSPDYPGFSPEDMSCKWGVSLHDTVSHRQMQVQMNFWEANYDTSLTIYDGVNENGRLLASFDQSVESSIVMKTVITTSGPDAYIVFTRGAYFPGVKAKFNATVKVKGYCLPGTLSCSDGESCYTVEQSCDGHQDCSTGYDEQGCKGCPPEEFWCGTHDHNCYTSDEKCNGMKNCQTNTEDEINCKSCGPGSFLCAADSRCIFERWRCDGDFDCSDKSDEEGCHYIVSRRVITAATIGSLVCCLLLVIALGCTCKLYSLRAAHHRHPHHHYRATPLTRVEREIFQRQAPPTYDMTVDGVSAEPPPRPTRTQRQRRHRNRRYQFQRAMPASASDPAPGSRDEGAEERSLQPEPQPGGLVPATSPPATNPSESDQNANANLRQSVASFMLESVPDILAELLFASRQNADNASQEGATPRGSTPRTSTPVPIETRDSGTQTNQNARNERGAATQLVPAPSNARTTSSGQRRAGRTSSRSRSRSRRSGRVAGANSNSREQQAKPLPKKKKIMPVMVPAPCPDGVVEDTLTCVYPLPPSYSQAVRSGSIGGADATGGTSTADTSGSSLGSSFEETATASAAVPRSPATSSPKNSAKSKFSLPFSIGQAIRTIAVSPFSKFQRNPYVQMENPNASPDNVVVEDNVSVDGQSVFCPRVDRPSLTSSDDDLIDCATGDGEGVDPSVTVIAESNQTSDAATTALVKVFPKYQKVAEYPDEGATALPPHPRSDRDSLELSDFSFSDVV